MGPLRGGAAIRAGPRPLGTLRNEAERMMKVLILTSLHPGIIGEDVEGAYRRLSMFIDGIAKVAGHVEIVHFVQPLIPTRFHRRFRACKTTEPSGHFILQ
jgi:hypothetical protein